MNNGDGGDTRNVLIFERIFPPPFLKNVAMFLLLSSKAVELEGFLIVWVFNCTFYVLYGVCVSVQVYSHDRVINKTCITYLYPKPHRWPSLLIGFKFQPTAATSFGYGYVI